MAIETEGQQHQQEEDEGEGEKIRKSQHLKNHRSIRHSICISIMHDDDQAAV